MVIEFSNFIFFPLTFCYIGFVILIYKIKNITINYNKEFINLCIYLSLLFIISLTLFPIKPGHKFEGFEIYNLIPFKVVLDHFMNYSFLYFLYQVGGNIALFVPLGYFLYLKTNKNTKKALILAFLTTLSIEIIQGFIPYRFCEIDDLWLNTLGAYIGIIICKTVNKGYSKAKS